MPLWPLGPHFKNHNALAEESENLKCAQLLRLEHSPYSLNSLEVYGDHLA